MNTTLDEDLLERIDAFASQRREDRSTAIRQLVDIALRELSKEEALAAYRQGRVTLREFASVLNIGIWPAHDLLLAEGVAVAQGDISDTSAAIRTLARSLDERRRASRAGGSGLKGAQLLVEQFSRHEGSAVDDVLRARREDARRELEQRRPKPKGGAQPRSRRS